jgi:DNA-binding IclR family transcriptional regulator
MKPAYAGTQAVLRAVRLLKALGSAGPEPGVSDLARKVGLHKATAYRLLSALESEGMVERGRGGEAYRLGPELLALGSRALGAEGLRRAARPELLALARGTRETVTLEVPAGGQVLILDEVAGSHVVGSRPSIGTRWPMHATSTGKALLAHLPDEQRDALLPPRLAAVTPRTITDRKALRRELERVRARGYAVSAEELEPGFVAVGAAVQSGLGVVAAISVGGPKDRLPARKVAEIGKQLPLVAARVGARLGHGQTRERPAGSGGGTP